MKTIIVTGKRDAGKTTWCRKNLCGPNTAGIRLDKAYYPSGQLIGYNAVRVETEESIPLLRVQKGGAKASPFDISPRPKELENGAEGDKITETAEGGKLEVTVGRFVVSARGMQAANRWIRDAWMEPAKRVLIDEVGRLELMDGGYAVSLQEIYGGNSGGGESLKTPSPHAGNRSEKTVYLVVRRDYLSEVFTYFHISNAEVWLIEDGEKTSVFKLP